MQCSKVQYSAAQCSATVDSGWGGRWWAVIKDCLELPQSEDWLYPRRLSAVQCSAIQYNTVKCSAIQCNTVQCRVMQGNAVKCSALQCNAVQCNEMQCIAVKCSAMQCNTVQYSTMQWNAVLSVCPSYPLWIQVRNGDKKLPPLKWGPLKSPWLLPGRLKTALRCPLWKTDVHGVSLTPCIPF